MSIYKIAQNGIWQTLAKLSGLFRDVVLARTLGINETTDGLFFLFNTSQTIGNWSGNSIQQSNFKSLVNDNSRIAYYKAKSNLWKMCLIGIVGYIIIASVSGIASAAPSLTALFSLTIYPTSIICLAIGAHNASADYQKPLFIHAVTTACCALIIFTTSNTKNVNLISITLCIAICIETMWLSRSVNPRNINNLRPINQDSDAQKIPLWPSLGLAAQAGIPLVDQFILAIGPSGSLSIYQYAYKIYAAPTSILITAISAICAHELTRSALEGTVIAHRKLTIKWILVALSLGICTSLFLLTCGSSIIALLYSGRAISEIQIAEISNVLYALSLLVPVYAVSAVAYRFIVSKDNHKRSAVASIAGLLTKAATAILLSIWYDSTVVVIASSALCFIFMTSICLYKVKWRNHV